MRTCPECGPKVRSQQAETLLEQMQKLTIYLLPQPATTGVWRRTQQNIKKAGCEYLRVPGTGIFTTWQGKESVKVSPLMLERILRVSIEQIPARGRISTSSGWTTAQPFQCQDSLEEKREPVRYVYRKKKHEIVKIAREMGLKVHLQISYSNWRVDGINDLEPKRKAEYIERTGRRTINRRQKAVA